MDMMLNRHRRTFLKAGAAAAALAAAPSLFGQARADKRMFEEFRPKVKIGELKPLSVIDYTPYEFYRMAPPGVLLVMIPLGLERFSSQDVERVFAPVDRLVDQLMEREVDIIVQSGTPLALLLGVEGHDKLLDRIAKRAKVPVTSTALGVVAAAKHLGLRRIALANKWSNAMNKTLGEFFARGGVEIAGVASEVLSPEQFQKTSTADSMLLAYELGRAALSKFPDAEGIYLGGGAWLSEPACKELEREFRKPAISNQNAMLWDTLTRLNQWKPLPGQGLLLELS